MLTIKTKVMLASTAVFGTMLLALAFLVYRSVRDAETAKLDAHLEAQSEKLQSEIEEQHDEEVFPVAEDILSIKTEGLTDYHLRILDSTGTVVLDDKVLPAVPQQVVAQVFHRQQLTEDVTLDSRSYRMLISPVEVNGRNLCVLQLASSTIDLDESLSRLRLLFLLSIPTALLLASVGAYVITRAAFRPITSMIETARRITADNLDSRLQLPAVKDEIRLLGETLNTMMDRISNTLNQQRQFIADASHELRTPLTVICSELEFVQQHTADAQSRESIGTALAEIDRLATMTQGMLMLTRMDLSQLPLNSDSVRLDELLVECVQLLKGLSSRKQINLRLHIDEAVEIAGDRDKLKSAMLNLLDNAIRYSNPCGKVSVSLGLAGANSVRIRVEDDGTGIEAADLPHIFRRFYRSAASRGKSSGSGLGLAIVEQVVSMHGGHIAVQSQPGKGSVFTIELPITQQNI